MGPTRMLRRARPSHRGGAGVRKSHPILWTEAGPGSPSGASPTPPSPDPAVTPAQDQDPPPPRLETPPAAGEASAARRAAPSPPARTPAGRDSAYLPPGRPGRFLPRPRRTPRLGPSPPGASSSAGAPLPLPLAPGPLTHPPAAGRTLPTVAALPLGATLLAARPRDTRTAPARPGPG